MFIHRLSRHTWSCTRIFRWYLYWPSGWGIYRFLNWSAKFCPGTKYHKIKISTINVESWEIPNPSAIPVGTSSKWFPHTTNLNQQNYHKIVYRIGELLIRTSLWEGDSTRVQWKLSHNPGKYSSIFTSNFPRLLKVDNWYEFSMCPHTKISIIGTGGEPLCARTAVYGHMIFCWYAEKLCWIWPPGTCMRMNRMHMEDLTHHHTRRGFRSFSFDYWFICLSRYICLWSLVFLRCVWYANCGCVYN